MKEYRLAKFWMVVIYIVSPVLIALFGWMITLSFTEEHASLALIPLGFLMIAFCIYGMLDAYKSRFIIYPDRIKATGVFVNRELLFNEIRGFRTDDNFTWIESLDPGRKKIRIGKYTGGYSELRNWLSEHFVDLVNSDAQQEKLDILANEELGWTEEERENKLKNARLITKIFNVVAGIVTAWVFFQPKPYGIALLCLMLIPFIGMLIFRNSKNLIQVNGKNGSTYPSIAFGIYLPALLVGLRALLDFSLAEHTSVWLLVFIPCFTFLFMLLWRNKEFTFRKGAEYISLLGMLVCMGFYCYGIVVISNCFYDHSEPVHFKAQVISKHKTEGKIDTYYLQLKPWGPRKEADDVTVSEEDYEYSEPGDNVSIYLFPGKLNIPWYLVVVR